MEYIDLSNYGNHQKLRKKYFVPESVKHPAKMYLPLCRWIIDKFCSKDKPEIILDPMAGIGSTMIMGMLMRPKSTFIGIELEEKFVRMANNNIKKVERIAMEDMFAEVGKAIVVQGDARQLGKVLKEKVNKIVTSPPFGKALSGGGIAKKGYNAKGRQEDVGSRSYMPENTGDNPNNIDNLKYGSVNKIISSPPWGGKVQHKTNYLGRQKKESGFEYSDNPENIGNLPQGNITKIISSPPYSEGLGHPHGNKEWAKKWKESGIHNLGEYPSDMPDNIGNLPHGKIDKIISSPPYSETLDPSRKSRTGPGGTSQPGAWQRGEKEKSSSLPHYGNNPNNIGSLKHGKIDKIITSPPYSNVINQVKAGHQDLESQHEAVKARARALAKKLEERDKKLNRNWGKNRHTPGRMQALETMISGYSLNENNIGNMKHGDIDKIITSPPYEGSSGIDTEKAMKKRLDKVFRGRSYVPTQTYGNKKNIGNTKNKTYLGEMLKVYQQCYQVLVPNGLMILVTKDFIRRKKRVPLTEHTIKLCEMVGFKHIATYHRKIENPSFWRILYRKRYPDAEQVDEEDITVFTK